MKKERPGEKAVVFSQFTSYLDIIEKALNVAGIKNSKLVGSMPPKKRKNVIDTFQNDEDGPQVMLISINAASTGLNITRANNAFIMDRKRCFHGASAFT